ncbi:LysR family transcriptional regulator [Aquabacterium sp.]|uniref:LysR family transcriptional regulator n=1 Tax=Aquabacterium sp. TaxID=1872578 RepID=UPI0024897210|nr:LysR family transcriptional regulator [Aquabacterium sp.]MDI1257750.1 LysR family transcriptional regulator [Aquabacterium sp.]
MNTVSDLAFFVALARQPSLAAAAQEMGITPPNVSRRLAALEKRLGLRLLNRTTRRLSLTAEGQRYLSEGEQILRDLEGLEESLAADRQAPRGVLRVNATFGFGRRHLAPAISDFTLRYPQVEVILTLTDHPLDLIEHAIDVGIQFGTPPDARVLARRVASNRRWLCASPNYLAEFGVPSAPQDLAQHRCIVIRENTATFNHWQLTNGQDQLMLKVRGPLSTNHGEVALDWALAGHGIVLRSEWDVAAYLRSGRLSRILAPWGGEVADIHAIYPQRHHLSAKVRVFLDFLVERFDSASTPPW